MSFHGEFPSATVDIEILFRSQVRPAELLVDGEKVKVIRRSETFEDMMKFYTNYYCFSQ